ncbi:LysR family transcriptional regulator [Streptomyces sp. NPDC006368]|uniref:LysR family transcriptional regulator n=1 Tax=Streptomyces sp. NPDC006368 TaxID=3156760 RepID=UPI0033B35491
MSTANMARWAHTHNIPLRPRGGGSHNAALRTADEATAAPAVLRGALTSPQAWQRLERFVAALRHPLEEAANALGASQSAPTTQITRLERDLGQPLLERAERGRSMRPTPFGKRVVAAAREILAEEKTRH